MERYGNLLVILMLIFSINLSAQTLRKQNQMLKDSIEVKNKTIETQKVTIDSLALVGKSLISDLNELKQDNDSLETVIDNKIEENSDLLSENDSLKIELSEAYSVNDRKEETIDSLEFIVENLNTEVHGLKNYYKKQDKIWGRKKYFNLGYNMENLNNDDAASELSRKFGASMTIGRTFYLHKNPILGMIKFGLDWSYIDLNVAGYNYEYSYVDNENSNSSNNIETDEYGIYKMELGMQFGPSVTVNPVDYLKVNVYFRYSPSYSVILDDEFQFNGSYGSYMNFGLAVSYKVISLGYEMRWGTSNISYDNSSKWDAKGSKVYISFRY